MSRKTLVIIPAYNAADYLEELIGRIRKVVSADILVVDDGSEDETNEKISSLGTEVLKNPRNLGKGYSLKKAFHYALDHDYVQVITIDADLQHLPEELPSFLNSADRADIFVGTRSISLGIVPAHRWLTNTLSSLIISILVGRKIRDSQSGYRMIKTDILKKIRIGGSRYDFETDFLFKAALVNSRIIDIPITTVYAGSPSYFRGISDVWRFIKIVWKRILI